MVSGRVLVNDTGILGGGATIGNLHLDCPLDNFRWGNFPGRFQCSGIDRDNLLRLVENSIRLSEHRAGERFVLTGAGSLTEKALQPIGPIKFYPDIHYLPTRTTV
jgi:hypothetical protein